MHVSQNASNKQKKLAALRRIMLFKFEYYEKASEDAISTHEEELRKIEKELLALQRDVPEVNEENFAAIEQDEWEVVDKYSILHEKVESAKEYLLSLSEMKIVYLFKSLEVVLKRLIQVAYPKANIRELYQWEKLEGFLKNRDINITILDGHVDAVQLRLVNNAIKHNGIINEEIKKIPEFKASSEFEYFTLGAFYDRIKPTVENFFRQIRDKVEEDLYDFPLQRLLSLAEEYYERMDDNTLLVFIEKLKEKANPNFLNLWPGSDQPAGDLPF